MTGPHQPLLILELITPANWAIPDTEMTKNPGGPSGRASRECTV